MQAQAQERPPAGEAQPLPPPLPPSGEYMPELNLAFRVPQGKVSDVMRILSYLQRVWVHSGLFLHFVP